MFTEQEILIPRLALIPISFRVNLQHHMWNCLKEKPPTTAGSLAESLSGLLCHVYVVLKNGKILNANREAQSLKGKKLFLICNNPKITAFPEIKSQRLWLLTSGAPLKFTLNVYLQVKINTTGCIQNTVTYTVLSSCAAHSTYIEVSPVKSQLFSPSWGDNQACHYFNSQYL